MSGVRNAIAAPSATPAHATELPQAACAMGWSAIALQTMTTSSRMALSLSATWAPTGSAVQLVANTATGFVLNTNNLDIGGVTQWQQNGIS